MSNYVIDENNNKIPAYSAQEVLSVLEQAIANGSLANVVAGKAIVDQLKCCVTGGTVKVAFVTQAKYNELVTAGTLVANCYYYITDDTTAEDIDEVLTELTNAVNGIVDGTVVVGKASALKATFVYANADSTSIAISEPGLYAVNLLRKNDLKQMTDLIWIPSLTQKVFSSNGFCYFSGGSIYGLDGSYNEGSTVAYNVVTSIKIAGW